MNYTAKIEAQKTINGRLESVRRLAPNMGVYQNEVSVDFKILLSGNKRR